MSCYFLIISSQQPDDDKITQLKSRISSEDFQNNIKSFYPFNCFNLEKYQINDINYCLLIDNPESTETFYYDWSSDLSARPEKLLQTKTIPINISARYIAANIHFLCNKISKDYQFIKALLFLKKEFYEDALSTTYILEAIYRLEEIYGACIVFYNGGEEVPYPFDKYNLNDPTNIFHINYLKSHCSLVYYNKKEKSCTNLCPFLNLSTNIDEPEFHLLRNIFYFLSFVEESNIPLCILQENYFQLYLPVNLNIRTFCSDCAVKPSQNFKNSFSFKQAFIFKCLFMDKNQNFGDWTSNMTVIWQRNMAHISDQLSGHVISPIHSSIKYAIAYPDEVSLSFNCYFVNTEILPQLSRLILADIDHEYHKIKLS
ncbi:hypothetical protein HZS_3778 [Henneguya salminicola]|nr:hypothetical protein HZS_3778 [Henneguya salminicola]